MLDLDFHKVVENDERSLDFESVAYLPFDALNGGVLSRVRSVNGGHVYGGRKSRTPEGNVDDVFL